MSESKELVIAPRSFTEVQTMADVLAKSTLLPDALKNKPADVAFAVMRGAELGLSPIASICGIHVISGKPCLSADTMVAVVLASGHAEYFVETESNATSCTWETKRKGSPLAQRRTWTMEDAKRAGLATKDTWRLYPRQMMSSRARSELARLVYPDILAGVQSTEEVESYSGPAVTAHSDAIDAEVIETPTIVRSLLDDIDTAPSEDALKALAPSVRDQIPPQFKDEANKRYKARLKTLREAAA
jgi:hypothetical protein